jgi:hypothetical protein
VATDDGDGAAWDDRYYFPKYGTQCAGAGIEYGVRDKTGKFCSAVAKMLFPGGTGVHIKYPIYADDRAAERLDEHALPSSELDLQFSVPKVRTPLASVIVRGRSCLLADSLYLCVCSLLLLQDCAVVLVRPFQSKIEQCLVQQSDGCVDRGTWMRRVRETGELFEILPSDDVRVSPWAGGVHPSAEGEPPAGFCATKPCTLREAFEGFHVSAQRLPEFSVCQVNVV